MRFLGLRTLCALACVWGLGIALCPAGVRAADDKVTLIKIDKATGNPEIVVGRVTKEDFEGIQVEVRDARNPQASVVRSMRPAEVASIEWSVSDPAFAAEWSDGMRAFKSGNYARAVAAFKGILDEEKESKDKSFRPEAKACLSYMHAESLFRAEKTAEAVPALETFVKEFKSSTYVTSAMGSLTDASIQTGKLDRAPALLSELAKLGAEQTALAKYYEGKLLRAKKQPAEAARKFSDAAAASSVPGTKGLALMGQAQCSIDLNNLAQAREQAQKAIASNPPPSVLAAAHLVIGDALMAEVDAQKPVGAALENMLVDALLEYMRITLMYSGDRNTEPKALFRAGEVLQRLGKHFPQRGFDRQRAVVMFNKLKDDPRYRGTEWANKAGEALARIR